MHLSLKDVESKQSVYDVASAAAPNSSAFLNISMMLSWLYARIIFYPTLLWNVALGRWLKVRNWWDSVDDHLILGAFPFASDAKRLADLGVGGVVNTCEEYGGPVDQYQKYGITQFRMPTIDFTHPSFDDVVRAIDFIQGQVDDGHKVYVHCKAGRARSATVAICWIMKTQKLTKEQAQALLLEKRPHINRHLVDRPVVQQFERTC